MPDVVVVGGGIIGAACARELARGGASVTLMEKDELVAGASGQNLDYLDTSKDPLLVPMARASLPPYLQVVDEAPFPVFLDREPLGTLAVTLDEDELADLGAWVEAARRTDVSPMFQPAPDGSIVTGTSREPAIAADPDGFDVPRAVARQAIRLIPALGDGLVVATGHGSEGVILGGGTAHLVRAIVGDDDPPFDPAPFEPYRFEGG